jgi:hypothetical protein
MRRDQQADHRTLAIRLSVYIAQMSINRLSRLTAAVDCRAGAYFVICNRGLS